MFKQSVRKEHLNFSLTNWLMNTLGLGPGIGDVFYLCVSGGAYHAWLTDDLKADGDHIFHTLAAAYAATTNARNDVILAYPGTYTVTAELDWANRYTHLVGVGGPNIRGYDTYGTQFYTTTATVARLIDLTGERCQFHNVTFANNGANNACLTSFAVRGYGATLKNSQFIGMMNNTQGACTLASSLEIAGGGSYLEAENCIIGTTEWGLQASDTNAPLYFSAAEELPADMKFTNCKVQSYIAATTRALIYAASQNAINRDVVFDRCEFYAFSINHAVKCAQVIVTPGSPSTHDVLFKDCAAINCTAYRTASNGCTWATGAAAASKSGVAIVTT